MSRTTQRDRPPSYYYDPDSLPNPPPGYQRQVYYGPPPPGYKGQPNQPIIIFVPSNDPEDRREPQRVTSEEVQILMFNDRMVRMAFIRKVYGILTAQLIFTFLIVCGIYFEPHAHKFARSFDGFILFIVLMIVSVILLCTLACVESARRTSPTNFILLGFFTFVEGMLIGIISSYYEVQALVIALGACVMITLAITLFAMQTKIDFTALTGIMLVILVIFFFFGILLIFIRLPILHMIYAGIGVLIFSIFLVIDTQLLLGGSHRYSISPEEYIFAALTLYIDIITLFLFLLQLIGSCNR